MATSDHESPRFMPVGPSLLSAISPRLDASRLLLQRRSSNLHGRFILLVRTSTPSLPVSQCQWPRDGDRVVSLRSPFMYSHIPKIGGQPPVTLRYSDHECRRDSESECQCSGWAPVVPEFFKFAPTQCRFDFGLLRLALSRLAHMHTLSSSSSS